jgi:allantoate deiminase
VATVGQVFVQPNAINIIPAEVRFSLDLRGPSDDVRNAAVARFREQASAIAERRKLALDAVTLHELKTTPSDAGLQDRLAAAAVRIGARDIRLPSGAAHDAMMLAKLCPSAMLFVRCKGGVSHNPAEYATPEDLGLAIAALIRFIEDFSA